MFFMMEINTKRMDNGFGVLATMCYNYQRLRIMKLYKKLEEQGIQVYGIKVDSLKIDYLSLNSKQKEYVNNMCDSNRWGGVKLEVAISKRPVNLDGVLSDEQLREIEREYDEECEMMENDFDVKN